ncbi:MAG TPA: glycerophosphodiester phosphodiesterase family protein [Candidatus Lumbricidophila sp.]|nr:glycerophosphodiester phosphodiesterase family protein [Candidatus Lumbricidophila sp.]
MPAARPLVIAHRGASGYRPEHTAAAYRLGVRMGADAAEPDLVATRDGVLVVRHENEISGTTDVATRPEFASRRRTQVIDGEVLTGWFTEDFTWAELSTLRARERLPEMRPFNAAFDGRYQLLRFTDLLELFDAEAERRGAPVTLVAEFKHATHFASIGLPLDELFLAELDASGWGRGGEHVVLESFEPTVLDQLAARGAIAKRVLLIEDQGAPADLVAAGASRSYDSFLTPAGLAEVAGRFDGISVGKARLIGGAAEGVAGAGAASAGDAVTANATASGADSPLRGCELVGAAHTAGLSVFTWTLRPENEFLAPPHRTGASGCGNWPSEYAAILETGVDGVFADHPDLALRAIDARERGQGLAACDVDLSNWVPPTS